jgi:hypothetical protein
LAIGIPLTLRRPTAAQLQPIVDKTAGKLPSWKAKLMNRAGRLAFVKAVLTPQRDLDTPAASPRPPKSILKLLKKLQRVFF